MNIDERFLEQNFGKERHFLVPDDYFCTFQRRMESMVDDAGCVSTKKAPVRRMRLIACAAACAAVLLVAAGVTLGIRGGEKDGGQALTVKADAVDTERTPMEQAAYYMMIDNDDLYAYIEDE